MNPKETSQEAIQEAVETLRRHPSKPQEIVIDGMRLLISVLPGTRARDEMTPQELSEFMRQAGPIFEGEEERIEELIRTPAMG